MSTHQPDTPAPAAGSSPPRLRPLRQVNGHARPLAAAPQQPSAGANVDDTLQERIRRVRAGTAALPDRDSALVDTVRRAHELKAEYQRGHADGKRLMQARAIGNWWFGVGFGFAIGLLAAGIAMRGVGA